MQAAVGPRGWLGYHVSGRPRSMAEYLSRGGANITIAHGSHARISSLRPVQVV